MWAVFLQTLPFFAVIGLGYGAAKVGFFPPIATAYLTRFVFYFALSAMLLNFSVGLRLGDIFSWGFLAAYLLGTSVVYLIVTAIAFARGHSIAETAFEAQCGVIGNVGFLGIPMLTLLLGEAAIGPIMFVLAIDLIVFGSIVVILVTGSRDGKMSLGALRSIGFGLITNPMIVSITVGLLYSVSGLPLPTPAASFLTMLGAAATPGALFAIGASLAGKSAERMAVAGWLSLTKLALHPAAVAIAALWIFDVEPYAAGVMITCAALPVAGNVYILAQHYGVAPTRVSASILLSTIAGIITIPAVIAQVTGIMP
ncbi:MAG: AEC family transporter [Rhodobacteraceae bacterium]|nr:AEC family transporter [Paracoccaceae bacterium]